MLSYWIRVTAPVSCGLVLGLASLALAGDEANDRESYDPGLATRTIEFWRSRTERDPRGFLEWRELSGAYLARQRETGDIADAVQAEKAARASLKIQERRNSTARMRLSRSLLTQHRFAEAIKEAEDAARSDASANRLVADIRLEIGDLTGAESALAASPPTADDLNHLFLSARIDEARGRHESALSKLHEACATIDARPDMPAETAAWTFTMLGHALIDSGHLEEGRQACLRALQLFPADYRAMTGLAEAASLRRDWKETARWAKKAVDTASQNPEALRLLAEALEKQGDHDGAREQERRLEVLAGSFPRIYDRHWALFCADRKRDLARAAELARKDLEMRKDPGAYDTLAWVSFQRGETPEARRLIEKAIATGVQSSALYYHASMIFQVSGDAERATAFLERSRALNPDLHRALRAD